MQNPDIAVKVSLYFSYLKPRVSTVNCAPVRFTGSMTVDDIKSKVLGRVGALMSKLTASHTKEARRMGCWSVIGEKSGAGLLVPGMI